MPWPARLYVAGVIAAGVVLAGLSAARGGFDEPALLLALVATSVAVHTVKVDLPVKGSSSTLSLGYTVSFASMLIGWWGTGLDHDDRGWGLSAR